MSDVHLNEEDLDQVKKRLRRAQGQLAGVLNMIEEERGCSDIVTQMAAVSKAVERAGFLMIAAGLEQCVAEEGDTTAQRDRLQKMFMSLA